MYMSRDKDYFEIYLSSFPNSPSLVIVRAVEAKNFPKEYLKEPILDLCCGDGFFAKTLGLSNIYGCDIDMISLEKATKQGVYKEVKLCDARTLDKYPSEFFNTIFANCALEHIDGIEQAIASISRVLKNGGSLIMTVPSENLNRWFPFGKSKLVKYNQRQRHVNIMSENAWRELLLRHSLIVERTYYLFNEKQYKIVILFDALPEILPKPIFRLYHLVLKITPKPVKKFIFSNFLKPIYQSSKPLNSGGELVIEAKKT